jgi:predicted PurR-regulated permease PerM
VTERIQRKVGGYVAGTLLVALIGGVATAVVLVILGVPYFLPLSLAMTLLGIVPYAGPAIGGVLVVSTTFAAAGRTAGVVMLIFFLAYQAAENNLLQPLVQRRTIRMNPLIILSVMLVGTSLAGVVGALLALPLAGAVQVVLREVLSGTLPSREEPPPADGAPHRGGGGRMRRRPGDPSGPAPPPRRSPGW